MIRIQPTPLTDETLIGLLTSLIAHWWLMADTTHHQKLCSGPHGDEIVSNARGVAAAFSS